MASTVFQDGVTAIGADWLNDVNAATYNGTAGYAVADTGAVPTTVQAKLRENISVKDFGAIGTAIPANVTADTAAFLAALATGKNVIIPQGTYYVSSTLNVGYGQCLWGSGRAKTVINYTGSGVGIYCGAAGDIQLIYDIELKDFTLFCTNKATPVTSGIMLENCVYFCLDSLSIFGPFNPNLSEPLVGTGLYLTNNTILGRISRVSARLWNYGYYLKTLPGSQSYWTAAIVIDGQGELANNMHGIVCGDPAINLYSAVGVSIRDMAFQGCYSGGITINSGDNTVVDSCYFEGNGNYDVRIGTSGIAPQPIGCKIINSAFSSEDLSGSPYGAAPYASKIDVVKGVFTTIRDNNLSISTAIPLITIAVAADSTAITGNRLNSTISPSARITNSGLDSIINDNYPNQIPSVTVGTFIRLLSAGTAVVSYTGVGFRPSEINFTASVDTVNEHCTGFASQAGSRCINFDSAGASSNTSDCIKIVRLSAGNSQSATLVSMDPDGFTLAWTLTGAPIANNMIVNYTARR
jgi:hypothetical protein